MEEDSIKHVTVCICTFKRPELLRRLLENLEIQITTEGLFTYSIVIADNDKEESARNVVSEFTQITSYEIIYCVEPEQNIAMARNKALENAQGDFMAFIDDDEFPEKDWLYNLYKACNDFNVDGVLGPVKPHFEHTPPQWVIKGKFFNRPEYETGYKMDWPETRSGNVLFKREILDGIDQPFRSEFGTGSEDVDFFRRMMGNGKTFIWCNNAVVYETVPEARCKVGYQLRMALLRGSNSLKHRNSVTMNLIKSLIAIPTDSVALPFLFVLSKHNFIKYFIKCFDHIGKVLAIFGIRPMKDRNF